MLDWVMEERSPDSAKAAVGGDAKRKKSFQGGAGSVAQSKNGGEQGEAPRDNASARDATATADAFGFGVLFFGVVGLFFSLVQGPAPAADAVGGRLCLCHFERRSSENRVVETVLSIRPSHNPR